MNEKDIRDIPSIKKMVDEANQIKVIKKYWPLITPILKLFNSDLDSLEENLKKLPEMYEELNRITSLPDKFNDIFSKHGWILIDSMKLEDAEQAILIYENEGINKAEEFLVNSISPEWVEKHVFWLEHIGGFQSRYILAKKSLEDYKAERYYASILVNLTLIDGWVNELNIINNHRKGFFADDSNLSAWDSITAHNKGLQALKELFSIPRMKTRTEEITIPYRHGIMHGMDLGYDNKIVAAKCWLALFAVREWAIKANKDELLEPKIEIKPDLSWGELIYQIKKSQENINSYNNWKPRDINIPRDFPEAGKPNDYPEGTPERVLINFFSYWKTKNYGYMAQCYSKLRDMKPVDVREDLSNRQLKEFKIIQIKDITPTISDIKVNVSFLQGTALENSIWGFRICYCSEDGELLIYGNENEGRWGITTWG